MPRKPDLAQNRLLLLEATRRILGPLACAARGAGIPPALFVSAARDAVAGSRSAKSGVVAGVDYNLALCLVGRWLSDSPYARGGKPQPLPRQGSGSFNELARRAGADPVLIFQALRAIDAIRVDRSGRVVLREFGYVPTTGLAEKFDILGRDAAEFIETILHNISAPPGQTRLQRKATYDNIGSEALPALRTRLRMLATQALMKANGDLARVDRDRNRQAPGGTRTRVSFGVYLAEQRLAVAKGRRQKKSGPTRRAKGSRS